ncbi:13261_t:CDS:2 [Funneliformis mosseae]|uniref:13261_t:CDS:1 n=1 Tax=Funneliformis mosseae TaxID=27381 RepID=A0A9N9BJI6_FUNMO|nr:13261_t:CDS:2 [Funneliformis mosseae]
MATFEKIKKELNDAKDRLNKAEEKLKEFKEGWKEKKIWELEKRLDDGEERNVEQRKGWVKKLQDAFVNFEEKGVSEDPNWNNSESIHAWIKHFKRNPDIQPSKFVSSFGSIFPLKGRENTIQTLWNGTDSRNGMYRRFAMRKIRDRSLHPIPILVGGPGTGKSRILQEFPELLYNYAQQYPDDCELKNVICGNKILAINVTFGNGSNVDTTDTEIGGEALVGCKQSSEKILVRSIIRAVGGLSCSSSERFYVPILSGTIQGPLEAFVRESTYLFLRLPLRRLRDDETEK